VKIWMIEVTEYWDDRYSLLYGKAWFSKSACKASANEYNIVSDHNTYTAVPIKVVFFDKDYFLRILPKKISYNWANIKTKIKLILFDIIYALR
jgi:hypothetical protein